jgi:hypothetical protein
MIAPVAVAVAVVTIATVARAETVRVPRAKLAELTRKARRDVPPVTPSCFAYSAREHAFACVGHHPIYNDSHIGAADQATNFRIDVIGPKRQAAWTIAAIGGRATTKPAVIERELATLGMTRLQTRPIALPVGKWVTVGKVALWLELDVHEGDASYENFGELRVRCSDATQVVDLRKRGIELGDTARVFLSPDLAWAAIGIVGDDGGEGTIGFALDTVMVELDRVCTEPDRAVWTSRDVDHEE